MAKKWTPSQKQLSLYDELLKRQNITRKRLLKRRRIAEEEGSSFGRPLPDLVLPMKVKRHRDVTRYSKNFDSYADYREKIKALQKLYGKGKEEPDFAFYKATYRERILNLVRDWIIKYLNFDEKPAGKFGKYSDEQKSKIAWSFDLDAVRFLELYNKMISLSTGEFMAMYDSGFIPAMKYVYEEIKGVRGIDFSHVDEFLDSYSDFRRQVRTGNVMVRPLSDRSRVSKAYKKALKDYNK